jgi:hypothetical protein
MLPPVSAHDISMKIHTGSKRPLKLRSAPDGKEIMYNKVGDHTIEFKIDIVEMFRMFILSYE